ALVTVLPFVLLIGSVARVDAAKLRSTTWSWAVHLGDVSFAFYLTQWLVVDQVHRRVLHPVVHWGGGERIAGFIGWLVLTSLLAEALHEVVERNAERAIRARFLHRAAVSTTT